MKRLAFVCSLLFVVSGASCDDDDKPPPRPDAADAAGDAGDAGGDAAVTCVGTFAGTSRATLGSRTAPSGRCSASGDLDTICTGDIAAKARACGTMCLASVPQAAVPGCVSTCIAAEKLSMGCADCYRDLFVCTLQKCTSPCTADPSSTECRTCQSAMGCIPAFAMCSGLPLGTPPGDGGVDVPPPDAPVEGTPEVTPEVTPEATPETTPEAAPETTPTPDAADGGVDADPDASAG